MIYDKLNLEEQTTRERLAWLGVRQQHGSILRGVGATTYLRYGKRTTYERNVTCNCKVSWKGRHCEQTEKKDAGDRESAIRDNISDLPFIYTAVRPAGLA